MAVDTRDKRFSIMQLNQSWRDVFMANPDNTIDTQDRAQLLWLYQGIALDALVVVIDTGNVIPRWRRRGRR